MAMIPSAGEALPSAPRVLPVEEDAHHAVLDRTEHRAAVDESAQRAVARWDGVLDRLGSI